MSSESDQTIVNQMIRYGENLRGTRAYWMAQRLDFIRENPQY